MLRICALTLVALVLSALAGCGAPRPPAWTLDPGSGYPAGAFLTGVGVAASRGAAEDQARSEIAKIFQVSIHSQVTSSESQVQSRVGALAAAEYSQQARAELTATTDKALSGVRIAELWPDPRSGEFYALAVLDRLAAARPLRGELNDLDLTIADQARQAEEAASPTRRLGYYLAALRAMDRRRTVAGDLQVLEPSGQVAEPPRAAAELAAGADRAAGEIRLDIELEGDRDGIVKGSLVRALTAVGMRLAPAGESNLTVRGEVTASPYTTGEPWQWTLASAQIDLLDGRGRELLDTLRATIREGARQADRSDTLAREKLGEKLAVLLVGRIGTLDHP